MKQLAILIGLSLGFWGFALAVGWQVQGEKALVHSGQALAICLFPAILTLSAALKWGGRSPETFLAVGLGGTLIRMGMVLGVVLFLVVNHPGRESEQLIYWITLFYLFVLLVEVILIVTSRPSSQS